VDTLNVRHIEAVAAKEQQELNRRGAKGITGYRKD
jgi:hypothetical protein